MNKKMDLKIFNLNGGYLHLEFKPCRQIFGKANAAPPTSDGKS